MDFIIRMVSSVSAFMVVVCLVLLFPHLVLYGYAVLFDHVFAARLLTVIWFLFVEGATFFAYGLIAHLLEKK
jgi:hypothetical protein